MILLQNSSLRPVHFIKVLFLALALLLFLNSNSYACTIFTKQQGDIILVGNNEDFLYLYEPYIWFVSPKEGSYGRVCFANASYVQGGMNEKGLFYDGAMCPATDVPYSEDKPFLDMDLGEVVISKCSNVDEAVEFLKGYNIPGGFGDHILFADETGKSLIVEWVEGEMEVIQKEQDYQIATNYFLSKPQLGGYPCKRYDMVKSILEKEEEISLESFKNILSATSQAWGDGGTKYSNVYDLKNKVVYVFCKGDYSKLVSYNIIDELKKMKPGEKKSYEIDHLEYEAYDIISSYSSTEKIEENGSKESPELVPNPAITDKADKSDKSTPKAKDIWENKWWLGLPVILVIFILGVWLHSKKSLQ